MTRSGRQPARAGAAPRQEADPLFGDAFLERLEYLEIVSRKAISNASRGERRRRKLGAGLEFADHRRYSPGDDFKHIDWNVYARLGKLLLRQYEEEDLFVYLLCDASASMEVARDVAPLPRLASDSGVTVATRALAPARTKLDQARRLAAALAYIALASMDRASVATFGEALGPRLMPARGKAQIFRVLDFLRQVQPAGATRFGDAMQAFVHQHKRRGLAVVLSDFYAQDGWEEGLKLLRYHRFEPVVVQLVDARELTPNLRGDVVIVDVETGASRELTLTPRLIERYRKAHAAFSTALEDYCKGHQIPYFSAPVRADFDALIVGMLRHGGVLK